MEFINKFLNIDLFNVGDFSLKVLSVFAVMIIFIITKVLLWLIKKYIDRKWDADSDERGNAFAFYQIIKYLVWIIAIVLILESVGLDVTVLLAGSAALLVGIGLGLQQTFNDILSGLILLTEGSTKVGDVLEVEGDVVTVQNIGIRTSTVMNRSDIIIIVPNSLITTNKVINWSHQSRKTRFKIHVGVAYGSDVKLVMQILVECAKNHALVEKEPAPQALFMDFGESSLDFIVSFYSEENFTINGVKSDIRIAINQKFIDNNITIPFPQRDLNLNYEALGKLLKK